jgi:monoamine oxidase
VRRRFIRGRGRSAKSTPPASDCAADALETEGEWNAYLQAISGFMNGAGLEQISVADYTAYDAASTGHNWRTPTGYGTVVAASLPHPIDVRLSTPVQSIELDGRGVELTTPGGYPYRLDRGAGRQLNQPTPRSGRLALCRGLPPAGRDEKLFLEIVGESSFAPETRLIGNPRDRRTDVYHIRPFARSVIECFMGDEAARMVEETGPAAGFAHAADELADPFGSSVRRSMHPLVASNWGRITFGSQRSRPTSATTSGWPKKCWRS